MIAGTVICPRRVFKADAYSIPKMHADNLTTLAEYRNQRNTTLPSPFLVSVDVGLVSWAVVTVEVLCALRDVLLGVVVETYPFEVRDDAFVFPGCGAVTCGIREPALE